MEATKTLRMEMDGKRVNSKPGAYRILGKVPSLFAADIYEEVLLEVGGTHLLATKQLEGEDVALAFAMLGISTQVMGGLYDGLANPDRNPRGDRIEDIGAERRIEPQAGTPETEGVPHHEQDRVALRLDCGVPLRANIARGWWSPLPRHSASGPGRSSNDTTKYRCRCGVRG